MEMGAEPPEVIPWILTVVSLSWDCDRLAEDEVHFVISMNSDPPFSGLSGDCCLVTLC